MAGAKSGVHVVQLKPIHVTERLLSGNKFVKWDDDSTVGTPVTLKVDPRGYFLFWTDQNKETEFLEISYIRDVRTGKYAKIPRDGRLRDTVSMGASDTPLEDKTVTVVHGPDLVNVSFINFCCNCRQVALEWRDELLKIAYNLLALNGSAAMFLQKAYVKLCLMTDRAGKIPVKHVIRLFASHKDDKKRVEKALEACSLPAGKNDVIAPEKFTFDSFMNIYSHLVGRVEVDAIFESFCGGNKKKGMTVDQLVEFLNKEQRDPRLNEILYPYANPARARDIINEYEPNKNFAQKGIMTIDGFLRYLMSDDNSIVAPEKFDLNNDMDQPLSHYFINSSHNTYLTGHQLTGKSSVEIYRQCLLAGCRCVELDCWNGRNSDEEPIITHGFTVVTEILLKEVLEAIADCAFKTSYYPVILSFENHCSTRQQAKIASYCRKIFGDMLLLEPISSNALKPGQLLPSPNQLLRKIIIKNKKQHSSARRLCADEESELSLTPEKATMAATIDETQTSNGLQDQTNEIPMQGKSANLVCDIDESDTDISSDDDDVQEKSEEGAMEKGSAEMSALVNYIQPVRFHSFEYAEKRNRSYEISSFVETQATNLLKEHPVEFVNYNKRQLSRIYPKGTRVDSSNYMPQVFWNAGCQLVALNYQTLDLAMQLNLGIFEYNGRSGYLLKPDFMRRTDRKFDPFTESTVDGIIAGTVSVKVISGQFLSDKRVGTYVEVDMYGLPADTVRRRFRTKTVPINGLNPVYEEDPFVFKKVVLPDLACIRIAVYEDNGRFLGHRVLPVCGLRPGYRHISLRNEAGQPLTLPTLFVHIVVKDYIPDGLSELADALANPIAYQSMVEKHAQQLMALTDDIDESTEVSKPVKVPSKLDTNKTSEDRSRSTSVKDDNIETDQSKYNAINGNIQMNMPIAGSTSPVFLPPLKRQETAGKNMTQSIRSIPDDNVQGKTLSLLESPEANIMAESIDKIKEHKLVQKVMTNLECDLQMLRKKHEKLKEKKKQLYRMKEDKLSKPYEQQKSFITRHFSRILKHKNKRDFDEISTEDQQKKMEDLHKDYKQTMLAINKEQFRIEMELNKKYNDTMYTAIDKAMQISQKAQLDYLKGLHDREVGELMKRLEIQTKEEMKTLSKKHTDKNELSRIKRELHQKLIEQAVTERQRINSILDKKIGDLERQHLDIQKKVEEEKSQTEVKLQQEFEEKCIKAAKEFDSNPSVFLNSISFTEEITL